MGAVGIVPCLVVHILGFNGTNDICHHRRDVRNKVAPKKDRDGENCVQYLRHYRRDYCTIYIQSNRRQLEGQGRIRACSFDSYLYCLGFFPRQRDIFSS